MYHKLADAIRQFDAVHLILFQGVTWEVVLPVGERCVSMLCPCIHCHPKPIVKRIRHFKTTAQHHVKRHTAASGMVSLKYRVVLRGRARAYLAGTTPSWARSRRMTSAPCIAACLRVLSITHLTSQILLLEAQRDAEAAVRRLGH